MAQYIAFLRGINVGGIRIKMADLRQAFVDLGMSDVKTILASGNVVFSTEVDSPDVLKAKIEGALSDAFGYEAWIVLRTPHELESVVDTFPFDESDNTRTPNVMFASDPDALDELLALDGQLNPDHERIQAGDGVLYWQVRKGSNTDSVFGKESSKARYKSTTTTRNTRTLRKILDAAST